MKLGTITDPYTAGAAAFHNGVLLSANHYKPRESRQLWDNGWLDEQEASPTALAPRQDLDEDELIEMAGAHGWFNLPPLLQEPAMQAVMRLKAREGIGSYFAMSRKRFEARTKDVRGIVEDVA